MTNYVKELIRDSVSIVIFSVLGALAGYVFRLILARNLSVAEFGLFYAVLGFVSMIAGLRGLGVSQVLPKLIAEFRARSDYGSVKNIATYYVVFQCLVYVVFVMLLLLFGNSLVQHYFKDGLAAPLLIILVFAFALGLADHVFQAVFLGLKQTFSYALLGFLRSVYLLVGLVLFIMVLPGQIIVPAYAYVVGYTLTGLTGYWLYRRAFPQRKVVRVTHDSRLYKRMFSSGLPLSANIAAGTILPQIDTILLTTLSSLRDVALYNVAQPTANVIRMLFRSVGTAFIPLSTELYTKSKVQFEKEASRVLGLTLMCIAPLSIGLVFTAPSLVVLLFGEEYRVASTVLIILALGLLASTIYMITSTVLLAMERTKEISIIQVVVIMVILCTDVALIPFFNAAGAALANTIGQFTLAGASLYIIRKEYQKIIPVSMWSKVAACCILLSATVLLVQIVTTGNHLETVIVSVLSGGVTYICSLFLFKAVSLTQVKELTLMRWRK